MSDVGGAAAVTTDKEIIEHYERANEASRLNRGKGLLERERTKELLARFLPASPAVVLDVGGGTGVYATWLESCGYEVHLIDPVAKHLRVAQSLSDAQPENPLKSISLGDARALPQDDSSCDAVLLLGPLYHLTTLADRMMALNEASRVLRPGGVVFAVGVSRHATLLSGITRGWTDDPAFVEIARTDLESGQHRDVSDNLEYWTTAYLHQPHELETELTWTGFSKVEIFAIQGPGWLIDNIEGRMSTPESRENLLDLVCSVESNRDLMPTSIHLMAVGRKR